MIGKYLKIVDFVHWIAYVALGVLWVVGYLWGTLGPETGLETSRLLEDQVLQCLFG